MPTKKWDKGRKRTARANTGSGASASPTSRRGGNTAQGSPVTAASGRTTNNSRGNRGLPSKRATPKKPPRRVAAGAGGTKGKGGRNAKKDTSQLMGPVSYTDPGTGEVYRPGDCAFVDSQQADLPYHICVIRDFKWARKDSLIAELKWFYRVSELPDSVYCLLMEDRQGQSTHLFQNERMRERELFMAFNVDTHAASLFRGKCQVSQLSCLRGGLEAYLHQEDTFHFSYGYKPESRRLTDLKEESFVPLSQQADIPECWEGSSVTEPSCFPVSNQSYEEMVWKPQQVQDEELLMYLRAARSVALHAGICMNGYVADGCLAASSDETSQHAFDVLHKSTHNTDKALQELVKRPQASLLVAKKNWSKENSVLFAKGLRQFGKNFFKIKQELLPNKSIPQLTDYYYYWKKTSAGLSSRSTRRQRKQAHIRMSRAAVKLREVCSDREYVELSSCDEEDMEGEEADKQPPAGIYACRNCFTQASPDWHHAGTDKAILCRDCRNHFLHYGFMIPITAHSQPPDFMFKDSQEVVTTALSDVAGRYGRKTRNSNASRAGSRPGLRSGKHYSKSGTDEEDDMSESCDSTSEEEEEEEEVAPVLSMNKSKPLQAQPSIINNLGATAEAMHRPSDNMPAKRAKAADSDEEAGSSMGSVTGEGGSPKSPRPASSSPSQSGSSSGEGGSPCSLGSPGEPEPNPSSSSSSSAGSLPQHFRRERKEECAWSCARTELVFDPPPEVPAPCRTVPRGPPAHTPLGPVPVITPHAPQLPVGPVPFVALPFPVDGAMPSASREEKHLHWLATMAAAQHKQQLPPHFVHGVAPPSGHAPFLSSHTAHPVEQQPVIFNFPSPDELARHRMSAVAHLAQPEPLPPGLPPGLMGATMLRPDEHQRAMLPGAFVPITVATPSGMEALAQQQQQQQQQLAAAALAAGHHMSPLLINPHSHEQLLDMYRQLELAALRDPAVHQNPQFQMAVAQCQAALHQHSLPPELQRRLQEEQQQMMMAAALGRAVPEERGGRPGVIVHSKMGT